MVFTSPVEAKMPSTTILSRPSNVRADVPAEHALASVIEIKSPP